MIILPHELQNWLDQGRRVTIIDTRPASQRVEAAIVGLETIAIPEDNPALSEQTENPVVLVCQFGINTERIVRESKHGYVYSLLGGVQAWNAYKTHRYDFSRYARQMVLPEIGTEGQQKLLQSRVAVVGLGGLGCPASQYLTAAGVGYLRIIDGDIVETLNIQRQPMYRDSDVGKSKARVMGVLLETLNPEVKVETGEQYLSNENSERLLGEVDIILDATDSLAARHLIDRFSKKNKIPMIYGGLYRFEGQVAVLNHNGSPGYADLFPEGSLADDTCTQAGILGMLPGIIGNIQALETIKILLDIKPNLSGKLLLYDGLSHSTEVINLSQ